MKPPARPRRLIRGVLLAAVVASAVAMLPPLAAQTEAVATRFTASATIRYYTMVARVRPFLIWMTRDDVGGARLSVSDAPDLGSRLELLVGSDPERAPMAINRWGFISESTQGGTTQLTGIMTETDDGSIDEARREGAAAMASGHIFRGMQSTVRGGEATTWFSRLVFSSDLTYRQYGNLLDQLPDHERSVQRVRVDSKVEPGFLIALKALVHDTVEQQREARRVVAPLRRDYLYMGKFYRLSLQRADVLASVVVNGRSYGPAIDGRFEIKNLATGSVTPFAMTYGAAGPESEMPLRVVYRPRWWVELELQIEDTSISKMAMSLAGVSPPRPVPVPRWPRP